MDLALDDVQRAVQETFRSFTEREIVPAASALDRSREYPRDLIRQIGELGYFGMLYPPPEGSGARMLTYAIATEELARGSLSVAAAAAMQSLMGTTFLHRFAEGEVRERLVGPALRGEVLGTICMTEPDSGSDLFGMSTRAEQRDGVWYLSGRKTWITSARVADTFTVFARTGERALSVFLVERGAPGLHIGRDIPKMGVRASPTAEVGLESARATCMLGEPGRGVGYLRRLLARIRVMTAALALGVGRAALEAAVDYAQQRVQFGKPINRFGAVRAHLAEMAVDLEAARRMTWWAAWRTDQVEESQEGDAAQEASMAKLFASEAALRICERAARVLASYGFAEEYPVERYLRDVRFTLIGGGTSEILRVNIARGLYR